MKLSKAVQLAVESLTIERRKFSFNAYLSIKYQVDTPRARAHAELYQTYTEAIDTLTALVNIPGSLGTATPAAAGDTVTNPSSLLKVSQPSKGLVTDNSPTRLDSDTNMVTNPTQGSAHSVTNMVTQNAGNLVDPATMVTANSAARPDSDTNLPTQTGHTLGALPPFGAPAGVAGVRRGHRGPTRDQIDRDIERRH